jgi:chromosome partitioning protein
MIVALAGQKGGVGKSTIAIALAAEGLAREIRTLLIDADPQGTCRTWGAVAAEKGHPTPTIIAMDHTMHRPGQLDRIAPGHDLVVIDLPARLGAVQASAFGVADMVLLPCGPTGADVWALAESAGLVTEAQARRPDLRAAVILTRVQGRTAMGRGARESAASAGVPVLRTELGYRVAYGEAITTGRGIADYDRGAAALEVRRLFDELELGGTHDQEDRNRSRKAPARSRRARRVG